MVSTQGTLWGGTVPNLLEDGSLSLLKTLIFGSNFYECESLYSFDSIKCEFSYSIDSINQESFRSTCRPHRKSLH